MTNANDPDAEPKLTDRRPGPPVGGGIVALLYGAIGMAVGFGYLQTHVFAFGNSVSVATPSVGVGILLLLFIPSWLPVFVLALVLEAWGFTGTAHPQMAWMFLVSQAVVWYGLGSFFHGLGCSPRKWLPGARRKGVVVGLVCIGASFPIAIVPMIIPARPQPPQPPQMKVEAPASPPERVMKSWALDVSLDGGPSIPLKRREASREEWSRLRTGREELAVFEGRESRLVGSRRILLFCQSQPFTIAIEATIEGSLFTPEQIYHYEDDGELQQQSYRLRSDDGEYMTLDIQTAPNYGEPDKPKSCTLSELVEALLN
jgi:hypothetical protein